MQNLLPYDGIVNSFILGIPKPDSIFNKLHESISWEHDVINIFGKTITTKREVAWYGDQPFAYTYSNSTKKALTWTKELLELKFLIEQASGETYNSCLLNLYHDGSESMGWHSDNEPELKQFGAIASLSLGATRKFVFKHKRSKEKVELFLKNSSVLIMKGETQEKWLHALPPMKKVQEPRINLTFRTIIER